MIDSVQYFQIEEVDGDNLSLLNAELVKVEDFPDWQKEKEAKMVNPTNMMQFLSFFTVNNLFYQHIAKLCWYSPKEKKFYHIKPIYSEKPWLSAMFTLYLIHIIKQKEVRNGIKTWKQDWKMDNYKWIA